MGGFWNRIPAAEMTAFPAIKAHPLFSQNKSKMASHWEFLLSLPFRRCCSAAGRSNYTLLSASPVAFPHHGSARSMCALEVSYSSEERSTPFFFLNVSLFIFSSLTSRSGLTSKSCSIPRESRFRSLIKDSRGVAWGKLWCVFFFFFLQTINIYPQGEGTSKLKLRTSLMEISPSVQNMTYAKV